MQVVLMVPCYIDMFYPTSALPLSTFANPNINMGTTNA